MWDELARVLSGLMDTHINPCAFKVPVLLSRSVVFWFGDLNFRIEDYDIHVVKCAIDSNKLPLLWERDQVRRLHFNGTDRLCLL